jgi:hypothetical protein
MMLDEPPINYSNKDSITVKYGDRNESYPYSGFMCFRMAYNCVLDGAMLDGHTTYYEDKSTSATPVAMGTYDYGMFDSSHIYMKNITQYAETGIADDKYWGIMGSNGSKNIFHENVYINRFDAHAGFWNGSIVNSTIGSFINVIGGGTFILDRVTRVGNSSRFMDMRSDYGSTFEGDIIIKDCVFEAHYAYNTGRGQEINTTPRSNAAYMISTGFTNADDEYLAHDFGYTCYMPKTITIDNFTYKSGSFYIFPNIQDRSFNNDLGTPYQVTERIIMKNMPVKLEVVQSAACTVISNIPVTYIPVSED